MNYYDAKYRLCRCGWMTTRLLLLGVRSPHAAPSR